MITNDRMLHMLGVARRCYALAKEEGFSEDICRDFFVMGLLHDIGYEFTDQKGTDHARIGYEMLSHIVNGNSYNLNNVLESIKNHGDCTFLSVNSPKRLLILNEADMTTDSKGNYCSIRERIEDIKERYGIDSYAYAKALMLVDAQELYKHKDYSSVEPPEKALSDRKLLSFDDRIINYRQSSTDVYLSQIAHTIVVSYNESLKTHLFDTALLDKNRYSHYEIKHTLEGYSLLHVNQRDFSDRTVTVRATVQSLSEFIEKVFLIIAGTPSIKWEDVRLNPAVQHAFDSKVPNNKDMELLQEFSD